MNLKDYLSQKTKAKGKTKDWLPFCKLDVKTGKLWAGDPQHPHASDGCVANVPPGRYAVEAIGLAWGRDRIVHRLRVRLDSVKKPEIGKELGTAGTDSGTIGIAEISAFKAAFEKASKTEGGADEIQEAIESQAAEGFGVITLPGFPDAIMPFVPTGSDGGGPVLTLMAGGKCVGIELPFMDEEDVE
jgi:hypothetical protein